MSQNPCARQTLLRWHPNLSLFAKAGAWTFGLTIGKAGERQPNGQDRDVRGFGVRSGRDITNQEGAGAEPRRSLGHALLVSLESAMYGFSLDQQEFAGVLLRYIKVESARGRRSRPWIPQLSWRIYAFRRVTGWKN